MGASSANETRAIAGLLNTRSAGVKDLRFGASLDEDWRDADPDEFLRDRCHEVPFVPGATYHFVATTATGCWPIALIDVKQPLATGRAAGPGAVGPRVGGSRAR